MRTQECKECHKEFKKVKKKQKFCSHPCSVKHNRREKGSFGTMYFESKESIIIE